MPDQDRTDPYKSRGVKLAKRLYKAASKKFYANQKQIKKNARKEEFPHYNIWYEEWVKDMLSIGIKNKDDALDNVE